MHSSNRFFSNYVSLDKRERYKEDMAKATQMAHNSKAMEDCAWAEQHSKVTLNKENVHKNSKPHEVCCPTHIDPAN